MRVHRIHIAHVCYQLPSSITFKSFYDACLQYEAYPTFWARWACPPSHQSCNAVFKNKFDVRCKMVIAIVIVWHQKVAFSAKLQYALPNYYFVFRSWIIICLNNFLFSSTKFHFKLTKLHYFYIWLMMWSNAYIHSWKQIWH